MSSRLWDRAAALPVPADGRRRIEIVALRPGIPTVAELFTFMRDAELRFETLRLRIEERVGGTRGRQVAIIETLIRHPRSAKVTTTEPGRSVAGSYEVWVSDGETVRTYSAEHRLGTRRPVRRPPVGLADPDLPGPSTVYPPLTPLPMETLPEVFVHPAGFCQNTLSTGDCWIVGMDRVAGREAIVLHCDHPRAVEVTVDRPDHHIEIAVDRETGIITRLVESVAGDVTRYAEVLVLETDPRLPPSALDFEFPEGTTTIY